MIEQKEAWQIRYVFLLSLRSCALSIDITYKSIIGGNDCTEISGLLMLIFVRTVDIFACVY